MQSYIQNSELLTHQQFLKIIYDEIMTSSYGRLTFEDENEELLIVTNQLTNYLVQNDQKFNTHLLKNMYKKRQQLQTNLTTFHNLRQKYLNFLQNKQILSPFDNYDTEKWIVHFDTNYIKNYPKYKEEFETYNKTIEFYNSFSDHINTYLLHLNKIFITQDFLKQIEKTYFAKSDKAKIETEEASQPKVPKVASQNLLLSLLANPLAPKVPSARQVYNNYFDFEQNFTINLDQ